MAHLRYIKSHYNVEVIYDVKHYTIDKETSFTSKPIIHGTFDIYIANEGIVS